MATSAKGSFSADVAISTDGGSTYTSVAEQATFTLSVSGTPIDVTNFDSPQVQEFIAGASSWTLSSDGNQIDSDAGQTDVFNNIVAPAQVDMRLRPEGAGAGLPEYTGSVVLTTFELSGDVSDRLTFNMEAQGSGQLNNASQ